MKHPMTLAAVFAIFALVLGACTPQVPATPTMSLADMQSTAMAQAAVMLTQTALAQPTATLPPTATPEPIVIEEPVVAEAPIVEAPVVEAPAVIVPDLTVSDNVCNQPVSKGVDGGKWYDATLTNSTKGYVDLYGYMYQTAFGCGFVQAHLAAGESVTISAPKGCYDFYGWQTGAKPSTPAGYGCVEGPIFINIRNNDLQITAQ
jgi:hypothetical protein